MQMTPPLITEMLLFFEFLLLLPILIVRHPLMLLQHAMMERFMCALLPHVCTLHTQNRIGFIFS